MTTLHEDRVNLENYTCPARNYNVGNDCVLIYKANDKDVLVPAFTTHTTRKEVPGVTLTIKVADNGFIVTSGKKVRIAEGNYALHNVVEEFTTTEIIKKEAFDIEHWEDVDLNSLSLKINTAYKAKQVRSKK